MKKIVGLFLLVGAVFALSGCQKAPTIPENTAPVVTEVKEADEKEPVETKREPEQITITHKLGETSVMQGAEKVVVFDYAVVDTLRTLGINVMGLPKSNVPSYLKEFEDAKYEDVGTLFEPDFEKLYALQPDVIFISARQSELYEEFVKIAPTVFMEMPSANYLETVKSNVEILGQIFMKEEEVQAQMEVLEQRLAKVKEKAEATGKNALIVMTNEGALNAYGAGSRFGIIHEAFGFTPTDSEIEVSNHGQAISYEYISQKNPDYMFVIDRAVVAGGEVSGKKAFDNELTRTINAYKEDKIIYLNAEVWYVASGGLQGFQLMIEEMEKALSE